MDAVTWEALGLALTVVGLLGSLVLWRRRGATAGLRGMAWSLLPLAAGLTWVLQLVWRIGNLVAGWALHVVLSPLVWLGVAIAGVSVVLFGVTGALRARRAARGAEPRGVSREKTPGRAAGGGKAPAQPKSTTGDDGSDDDMADVQAILKRHGIS